MDTLILRWVTFIYFASFIVYISLMIFRRPVLGLIAAYTALMGLVLHTVGLAVRWKESYNIGIGHAPLSNFYESLVFFAWSVVAVYAVVERRLENRSLGVVVMPAAFLLMASASLFPGISSRIQPLVPALQSNWLTIHVVTCFFGYGAFTVAFGGGIMYLIKNVGVFTHFSPDGETIVELIYRMVQLGFVFLGIGIMTGSVWAHFAWGSYWSWDPKETWSLITWSIYAVLLHARYVWGWRGKGVAYMAILGFASVMFTYLGVNCLPGLHSYLKM